MKNAKLEKTLFQGKYFLNYEKRKKNGRTI